MENASKALIIAGAILLSILLISLGIMIYNQAQDTVNNSGMSQAELQAFNNKFLKYEGTRTGSEVKALINEVIVSNADGNNEYRQVYVKIGNGTSTYTPNTQSILNSSSYNVKMQYATYDHHTASDDVKTSKGCICRIYITEN